MKGYQKKPYVFIYQPSWWTGLSFQQRTLLCIFYLMSFFGTMIYCFALGKDQFQNVRLKLRGVQNNQYGITYTQKVNYNVVVYATVGLWTSLSNHTEFGKDAHTPPQWWPFLQEHAEVGKNLWNTCLSISVNGQFFYYTAITLQTCGLMLLFYSFPVVIAHREAMILMAICGGILSTCGLLVQCCSAKAYSLCVTSLQATRYRDQLVRTFWNNRYFSIETHMLGPSTWSCMVIALSCFLPMTIIGIYLILLKPENL
ncbi:hypothetical protein FGIG_01942 [Fasciola gigantica]|uniref:Transmembrane protein n=1 Tax=Fasciola gigantica TaxID=46835 RepID=A0A504YSG5_FASGI|nr:hypothetical protein FGIG_01942 [Fasciola gigantica]